MRLPRDRDLMLRIALVLKDLRDESEESQATVYEETNIHIGRLESCAVTPNIITLSSLCDHFGIDLGEFFTRVVNKSTSSRK